MADVQEPNSTQNFDDSSHEKSELVDNIKKELEGWREVLLPLHKLLTWDKPHYPGILVGVITLLFMLIWYLDPSVLTTFSLLGLLITLTDYLVPTVASNLFKSNSWTGEQERQYENICIRIHNARVHIHNFFTGMHSLKNEKPKTYFMAVITFLVCAAWIGSLVDNLLLSYLIVVFLVLLPGLRHHGIIQKYTALARDQIKTMIQGKKKKH